MYIANRGIVPAASSLIFLGFFIATLWAQVASSRFHPFVYWAVVVATTTVGTTTLRVVAILFTEYGPRRRPRP